jgi:hypothetical protein
MISIENSAARGASSHRHQVRVRPRSLAWLDVLVACCAAFGMTFSALYSVQMRASNFAASDFKTLYASVWCIAHRLDAYSIANLQRVFDANGVIQPEKWYGHAPVYPATTLALLSPFAAFGMVPAAYVLTILSGVLLAIAMAALMRYAALNFDLGPFWRIAIAGLFACGPLLNFGMNMGNVSLAASALCFIAFLWRDGGPRWIQPGRLWVPATALAIALLLKPHLGLWVGVGMFLLPERRARAVVVRAAALTAGFAVLTTVAMAAMGTLRLETHSYLAMLSVETSSGASMNSTSREALPVVAQITSLESILGFWITSHGLRIGLTAALLLVLAVLVYRQTRRVDTERGALLAVGAWCAFGMLATYHRAHDAVLLIIVLPWVVERVRRSPLVWHAWLATALYCAMSASADFPVVQRWLANLPANSLQAFLLLRQVGLADLLLLLVLLMAMHHEHARRWVSRPADIEPDELATAA